jgi:hypothetical protein
MVCGSRITSLWSAIWPYSPPRFIEHHQEYMQQCTIVQTLFLAMAMSIQQHWWPHVLSTEADKHISDEAVSWLPLPASMSAVKDDMDCRPRTPSIPDHDFSVLTLRRMLRKQFDILARAVSSATSDHSESAPNFPLLNCRNRPSWE